MPAALTMQEKKERAQAKQAEGKTEQVRSHTERPGAERKRRNTFNGTQAKLVVGHDIPGYKLYGFNDTAGRIQEALDTGWEFVSPDEVGGTRSNVVDGNTDLGDKVRWRVGKNEDGSALFCYVMKIRNEWYEEDQAALQARNDAIDDAIRNGRVQKEGYSTDGFYTPTDGIKYGKSDKF